MRAPEACRTGIVDKLRGNEEAPLTAPEAMAGIGLYAIIADERVADEELETLRLLLRRMRLFNDGRLIGQGLDKALKIARTQGDDTLLRRAAAGVPPALRATAFALAADVMLADSHVADEEEAAIVRVQAALAVPDDVADRILEVMRIRNMG